MSNAGCVSLSLPFGMSMTGSSVSNPSLNFDPMRALLGNLNGVLTPFMPIFKIVGFAGDVKAALDSIPDCITQLSPKPLVSKLAKVAKDIDELLGVLPQTSVPVMMRGLLGALITYLRGVQAQILGLRVTARLAINLQNAADGYQQTNPDAYAELSGIAAAAVSDGAGFVGALDAQSCAFNELCRSIKIVASLVNLPAPPLLPCFNFSANLSPTAYDGALSAAAAALEVAIDVLLGLATALGGATAPTPPC